jgi:aldose sugar dehydrogenase
MENRAFSHFYLSANRATSLILGAILTLSLAACSSDSSNSSLAESPATQAGESITQLGPTPQCVSNAPEDLSVRTEPVASGLISPWAMAFLPDGRLLVTQRTGSLVLVSKDGSIRIALAWPSPGPQIREGGQGGLLDVALDPDFSTTPWLYFTYQEPADNNLAGTAVGRVQLRGNTLSQFQRLYQQQPKVAWDGIHFGSRLAFTADKYLYVSLGDRGQDSTVAPTTEHAQNLGKSLGKIIRLQRDGTIPNDNPFVNTAGALPEIYSWGHRNPQGLTVDAASGQLWSAEHGAQGGDEVNRVLAGANYGWPLRSYSCPYGSPQGDQCRVGGGVHLPVNGQTFSEPLTFWAPVSTAPSNLIVYSGAKVADWKGNLLVGALAGQRLWRITLKEGKLSSCDALLTSMKKRVRDVREGPDGWIWLLTDEGEVLRVVR